MGDEGKQEAITIITNNNPDNLLKDGDLDVSITRYIQEKTKEYESVPMTPELIKAMSAAEMIDYSEVEDGLTKKVRRVGADDKDALARDGVDKSGVELIGMSIFEASEIDQRKDVADSIDINSIHENLYDKWNKSFEVAFTEVSQEQKLSKTFKRLEWKEFANKWLGKLHIPYRVATSKESEAIYNAMKEIMLRVNKLDDKSIEHIKELRKNNSIEGIRENLPNGVKLWGSNPVGIAG